MPCDFFRDEIHRSNSGFAEKKELNQGEVLPVSVLCTNP
jgi:hypothetical protein